MGLRQVLCWPLGLKGCPLSLSQYLRALRTYCPKSCIFYKLRHNVYTVFFIMSTQSAFLPFCVSKFVQLSSQVVWPVNSPTAALCLSLLIGRSPFALPGVLDSQQPVQAPYLAWCSSSKHLLTMCLPTPKGITTVWLVYQPYIHTYTHIYIYIYTHSKTSRH